MIKRIQCPVCGVLNHKDLGINIKYIGVMNLLGNTEYNQKIVCCPQCGMAWAEETLDDIELSDYYSTVSNYASLDIKEDSCKSAMIDRQYAFVNNNVTFNSILEIGAATGLSLSKWKKDGKTVCGIEPSKEKQDYAKKNFDIELIPTTLAEYQMLSEQKNFEMVWLSQVFEHLNDVQGTIDSIYKLSTKYVFVEIPVLDTKGVKEEPYGVFFHEHVNYFSIYSFSYLMSSKGFELVNGCLCFNSNKESPGFPTYMSIWEKRLESKKTLLKKASILLSNNTEYLLTEYVKESEMQFRNIREKVDNISNESKLAVWGGGGHTARLLGMTDLMNKNIIKFYDSDKNKYSRKMVNKPIQAFSMDDILNGTIDTILISTFSSERAICEYLISMGVDTKCNIITLYS